MRAATMFSGIGSPEAACPDWDWLWSAEIERFPSKVHEMRHGIPNLGDVTRNTFIESALDARPTILIFGTPCQSFSVAGKRLGLDDPRGNLSLVALELARKLGVRWLAFENVPGLFSNFSGSEHASREVREFYGPGGGRSEGEESRDFAAFLSAARQCGYLGCWRVFDAQYFGVPQRRRRVFFVGYIGDWRPAAAVLFEPENLRGHPPPRREAREGATPDLDVDLEGEGCEAGMIPDVAWSLQERDSKGVDSDTKEGHLIPVAMNLRGRDGGAMPEADRLASLRAADGGSSRSYVAFSCKDHGQDAQLDMTPALRAMGHDKSHANAGGQLAVADQYAVRRLTPRECERLMGFDDDFTMIPWRGRPAVDCPDGPRYKALGNSMAVPVMRWILSRIETMEGLING